MDRWPSEDCPSRRDCAVSKLGNRSHSAVVVARLMRRARPVIRLPLNCSTGESLAFTSRMFLWIRKAISNNNPTLNSQPAQGGRRKHAVASWPRAPNEPGRLPRATFLPTSTVHCRVCLKLVLPVDLGQLGVSAGVLDRVSIALANRGDGHVDRGLVGDGDLFIAHRRWLRGAGGSRRPRSPPAPSP